MTDLWGNNRERYEQAELLAGKPAGRDQALAELREIMLAAERVARIRPDDEHLRRRAAAARRDYLQLRDHAGAITADELAAEARAEGTAPTPADNAELGL